MKDKMTKKEKLAYIAEKLAGDKIATDFCAKEIAALDAKAAKAKERAAKKAVEGDALMEDIYDVLTENPMTLAEIVTAIDRDEVTANKVSPRAIKLAEAGRVVKTEVKDGKRKLVAYMLPVEDADKNIE